MLAFDWLVFLSDWQRGNRSLFFHFIWNNHKFWKYYILCFISSYLCFPPFFPTWNFLVMDWVHRVNKNLDTHCNLIWIQATSSFNSLFLVFFPFNFTCLHPLFLDFYFICWKIKYTGYVERAFWSMNTQIFLPFLWASGLSRKIIDVV